MDAKFWVGCVACYNQGKNVGEWFDLEDVQHVEPEDIHPDDFEDVDEHEELWCYDHENVYLEGECSLGDAIYYADVVSDISLWLGDDMVEVFFEWKRMGYGDDCSDFQDKYYGEYESETDFAEQFARETGSEIPDWLDGYIDWNSYARDLMHDFVAIEDGNSVHIFHAY